MPSEPDAAGRPASPPAAEGPDLDPLDWGAVRSAGHRMLDDMLDHLQQLRTQPVWRPIPAELRQRFRAPLPRDPAPLDAVYDEFAAAVLPYAAGNLHPAFMGWVHGGGTVEGMLAELLAGGLNANLGGRDQMPVEVERQVVEWVRQIFGFPEGASGLFVTGSSQANLIAVLVARRAALGPAVRRGGVGASGRRLVAYASAAVHGCVPRALDIAGLGSDALRPVPTDAAQRIDLAALAAMVAADRAVGLAPFLAVGSAGTVDVGAVDDLEGLARLCAAEGLWFHVDGALGGLAMLAPALAPLLAGIERADSLALDFHKWGQVPYDAGFVLVRDGALHRATFAAPAAYLRQEARGLAAGAPWFCDLGPDLSRGFRALKTWFTLKVHGTAAIGRSIAGCCAVARHLAARVAAEPRLELLAPVALNVVCFRHRGADPDALNAAIVADLHESGLAAPSTTVLDGRLAIRAAIVNHRTRPQDADALVDAVLRLATARGAG
jgi:glutamate/tyrosine decarboxylase-like PLP-dependent enzyme